MQELLGWRKSWAEWAPHALLLFVTPTFYNENPAIIKNITNLISDEDRDMKSYDYLATAVLEHDILDQLSGIKTPALVMAGRYDPICSMTSQNWMMDVLPNARLEVFENSSHFFLMEEASRALEVIKNWLANNSD